MLTFENTHDDFRKHVQMLTFENTWAGAMVITGVLFRFVDDASLLGTHNLLSLKKRDVDF